MSNKLFKKDPDSIMDYSINYTDWLVSPDIIVNSTWTSDAGITVIMSGLDITSMIATVRLSGGVVSGQYRVKNTILTTTGLQTDRSIFIEVEER